MVGEPGIWRREEKSVTDISELDEEAPDTALRIAWAIALGGFLPFAAIAAGLVLTGRNSALTVLLGDAFRVWSLAILSFLGGIRWGMVLTREAPTRMAMIWPVAPAILGWAAMFLPQSWAVLALLVAYCAMGAWDSLSAQAGTMPAWYGNMRIVLTLMVAGAHAVAFAILT
jgi:hypothetical protein